MNMSQPVREVKIDSVAFRQALLKSERLRIQAVIVFVIAFAGAIAIRILVYGSAMNRLGMLASFLLVAYEVAALRAVDQALKRGNNLSTGV
jgi:hypothetical protein